MPCASNLFHELARGKHLALAHFEEAAPKCPYLLRVRYNSTAHVLSEPDLNALILVASRRRLVGCKRQHGAESE